MNAVPERVARPVRGLVQGAPALAVVEFIDAFWWDMDNRQYGAAVVLLTLIFSFLQTAYEDRVGKGLLREVPPTAVPVVGQKSERRRTRRELDRQAQRDRDRAERDRLAAEAAAAKRWRPPS